MSVALQGQHLSPNADPDKELIQRVHRQFESFNFSEDDAFQQGLSGILARASTAQMSEDERDELVLKTKVFYFNRVTGHDISLEDVQARSSVGSRPPAHSGNEREQTLLGDVHQVLTFAELRRLIEQGNTEGIPNNKTVPNALNDGVPSESNTPVRKKPWEVASQS